MRYLTNHSNPIKTSGDLSYLQIGEEGRNRTGKKVAVKHPEMVETFKQGMALYRRTAFKVSVNAPKPGRPGNISIIPEREGDESGYLLNLVADGGYHRGRNDRILVLTSDLEKVTVLAKGQGRDGIAGNIGKWSGLLLTAAEGTVFKIALDRSTCYLRVTDGKLQSFTKQEAELHELPVDQDFTNLSL